MPSYIIVLLLSKHKAVMYRKEETDEQSMPRTKQKEGKN